MTTLQKFDQESHKAAVQFSTGVLFTIGSGFLLTKVLGLRVFYGLGLVASPLVGIYLGSSAYDTSKFYDSSVKLNEDQMKLQETEALIKIMKHTHGQSHENRAEYILKYVSGK